MEGKRNIAKVMHPLSCIEKVDEISKSVKLHDISAANYAKLSHAIWHYLPPTLRIYLAYLSSTSTTPLELETKVHPKVRNHGEGPY